MAELPGKSETIRKRPWAKVSFALRANRRPLVQGWALPPEVFNA